MTAAHTPGPWAISYSVDGMTVDTAKPVRFNLTTAGTAVIARVCAHEDAEHFSGEANARLIAAAPDLAQALADLIEAADSMAGTYGCIRGDTPEDSDTHTHDQWAESFLKECADAARAAIAKATGEGA